MTKTEWNDLVGIAADMGDKFKAEIDRLGQDGVEQFQRMIAKRFGGDGVEYMDMAEWVVFVWRYHSELGRRERNDVEADTLLQWAIEKWLLDRNRAQLNMLMLGQDERSRARPTPPELESCRESWEKLATYGTDLYASMGQWAMEADYREGEFDMTPRSAKILADKVFKYITGLCTSLQEAVQRSHTLFTTVETAFTGLAATIDGMGKENVDFMKSLQTGLEKRQKAVVVTEGQLGLYSTEADNAHTLFKKTMEKAERYRIEHPREYEWVCPKCDWSGQLLKRQRAEGALINILDLWWVWKCPSCGEMIAYDKEHPLFDGKIVFSLIAWELVKAGDITLVSMAKILETAPEHIVYALRTIYHDNLPEHVQKEWEKYDKAAKEDIVDDRDDIEMPAEMLGDPGEEQEEEL